MTSHNAILQELTDKQIERVKVGGFDIDGILRGKFISKDKLVSALEGGLGFCDVIFGWDCNDDLYDNGKFTGWHSGYPDVAAKIDPETMRIVPWEDKTALFLLDFYEKDGSPLSISPQQVVKKVVQKAHDLGFEPIGSCEFEFFIFAEQMHSVREKRFTDMKPLSPGMFGYSVLRASMFSDLVSQLLTQMEAYRCPIEGIHTETGPGVYECALTKNKILNAAREAALFKTGAKEIANRHGVIATFMAKWKADLPGCSGHIHQSLWNRELTTNLFAGDRPGEMSKLMKHYLAGLLRTLPEFLPLYAPTVNSYKRLVEGSWAPTKVSWGSENRTTSIRAITGPSAKATRLENRVPGSDMNPFLAMAGTIAAGLYGIEAELELPAETLGSAYRDDLDSLPSTLAEATRRFAQSEVARTYLGEAFVDHYARTRDWESRQYRRAVTDWELNRYFEII